MKVEVISEHGLDNAALGALLSFGKTSGISIKDFIQDKELILKSGKVLEKLGGLGGGHDEFLKHINVCLDINMPLYWWTHMDQYKFQVDLSESKMHTLLKGELTKENFSEDVDQWFIYNINDYIRNKDFKGALSNLPFGFLQRRIVTTNYMTLRNIYGQRRRHKLKEWHYFCEQLEKQLNNPQWLKMKVKTKKK